uniref:Multi antimicrobial extrusion protein MatE n=1 Tax=Caulobacter sp. (strain K31) TaxID=366602 RepID=B0T963_CAUSK
MSTTASAAASPTPTPPLFVRGSIMRHVAVMASTGAIGLIAVFLVDLLSLFYVSRLGDRSLTAAVGFAGVVGFFHISVSIGMMIGVAASVARSVGAGEGPIARRLATSSLMGVAALALVVGIATFALAGPVLDLLGADGPTHAHAVTYLRTVCLSFPLMACGMSGAALLRSVGAARQAMNVSVVAAVVAAILDPILIFGLHLGLNGAAISVVASRIVLASLALRYTALVHELLGPLEPQRLREDLTKVLAVAAPAILTNLATPVAAGLVTHALAGFGPAAVAGQATIDRITPVAFGLAYATTAAVGPIMAQNRGAARPDRVRLTLRCSLAFVTVTVAVSWSALALLQNQIVAVFAASGITAQLVRLFCSVLAGAFIFTGALFVANASFNNLGRPLLSTAFNWGRATLGTIPFIALGAHYGPAGVLIGQAAGSVLFGLLATCAAIWLTAPGRVTA